jgi:hypothetical protein
LATRPAASITLGLLVFVQLLVVLRLVVRVGRPPVDELCARRDLSAFLDFARFE